jgi:hypothetical protein
MQLIQSIINGIKQELNFKQKIWEYLPKAGAAHLVVYRLWH